jgi:hypothetical protein
MKPGQPERRISTALSADALERFDAWVRMAGTNRQQLLKLLVLRALARREHAQQVTRAETEGR